MSFTDFDHGITAIDTDLMRPRFDASHLIVHNDRAAFVDTGVHDSVPRLLQALAEKGIAREQVDYVLLTHIHLDHAGGAGELMRQLPNAVAVLHPRGARHMIDPAKLKAGSIAVYGEEQFARIYGDIIPIDEDRVRVIEDGECVLLGGRTLECIHTEGHARHHYCIVDHQARVIFAGDTFGVSYRELDTDAGQFIFPTTTPVHFDPVAAHASVDRLLSYEPEAIYLTHYSRVDEIPRLGRDMHTCLDAFVDIAHASAQQYSTPADVGGEMAKRMLAFLTQRLHDHGFTGSDEQIAQLLMIDVTLNVQGLQVWLSREQQA